MSLIKFHYDSAEETFWSSREKFQNRFKELGGKKAIWHVGGTTPSNWLGYSKDKPSPGHDINYHIFEITDHSDVFIALMLGGVVTEES